MMGRANCKQFVRDLQKVGASVSRALTRHCNARARGTLAPTFVFKETK
jgi:hypothetical protein